MADQPLSVADFLKGNTSSFQSATPSSTVSAANQPLSVADFLKGSSNTNQTPTITQSPSQPTSQNSNQPLSVADFLKSTGSGNANQSPASSGWNGLLDNPITRAIGSGYTHTVGGMQGMVMQMLDPTSEQGFIKGFSNPTAENQDYQNLKSHIANTISPLIKNDMSLIPGLHPTSAVGNAITNFGMDSVADPLSYVPVGPVAKVMGKGLKLASDAVGATPYISKALTATANAPGIKQVLSGTKNAFGHVFTKNYGASPALAHILQNSEGAKAVDQHNILGSISDLSQGHGLTPEELNQTGHVVEGTTQGTPAQQAFAQKWSDLAYHGPGGAHAGIPQTLKDTVGPAVTTPAQAVSEVPTALPAIATTATPKEPFLSYNDYQNLIDNHDQTLIQKYGNKEYMNSVMGLPSKIPTNEWAISEDLLNKRDAVEKASNDKAFNTVASGVNYSNPSQEWVANKDDVQNALNNMYRENKFAPPNTVSGLEQVKERLYNSLIQKTNAPSELWGEYGLAKKWANNPSESPLGTSLKPLMNQIDEITNGLVNYSENPAELAQHTLSNSASPTTPAFSPENLADAHHAINEINTHINGLDSGYQKAIADQYQLLKNQLDNRGGVTQGSLMRDSTGAVTGRVGRISQNPEWYQNFYAQNGKVPSNKDLLNLAQEHVDNGYSENGVQVPSWAKENDYHATKASLVAVRDEINGSLGKGITPAIEGKMAKAGVKRTPAYQFEPVPQGAIGTHAMLNTPSAVNGQPLLRSQIDNHFAHMYDSVPADQVGTFPKQEYSGSGLTPDGSFNKPRTYDTLQDAQQNGLKPVLDPFQVVGHQLKQSSDALRNNEALAQIKSTPGLLFAKDPIDEIAKLAKTGRMDSAQITQAKQALGLTEKDMKPGGIVQSKVPQLSGYYIRKADEAALQDHLNPVKPRGLMGVANKAQETYNKGYLLNPTPHLHNVYVNGIVLGGAKPSYINEAFNNITNGIHDPMYMRALQSGAINNPVGGKFSDAISRTVAPSDGGVIKRTARGIKSAVNGMTMGTTPLKDNIKAPFAPLYNASHNLLWNNDKAIRTALFRGAVEKGATDAQAAAHVNKFMVNYNNITPFERQYIKPLVPFYAWKKGNMPLQASQMVAQSPKYAIWNHAKNAVSQALSGQPTDAKGRVNSGQRLPDGSTTMLDLYNPMDDVTKAAGKGALPYLYSILSPAIKDAVDQGSSLSQVAGLNVQNKYSIYNPAAPLGWNIRAGLAHSINDLNPLSGSAVAGSVGSQSNLINSIFGMPTNNKPNTSLLEAGTKLLGGFTSRDNPATDAKNLYYQNKDNKANLSKYRKILSKTK